VTLGRRGIVASAIGGLALVATLGGSRYGLRRMAVDGGPLRASPGTYETFVESNGIRRRVLVYVPRAISRGEPLPIVLALHGAGSTGERLDDLVRLTPIADREGFVVAFPDALGKVWNASTAVPAGDPRDDVAFLLAVLEAIGGELPIESQRAYAAGFSNGAMMANRLAIGAGDRIAAVALVAGAPAKGVLPSSIPPRPVPVIAFHGSEDRIIRYGGGSIGSLIPGRRRGVSAPVEELKRFWARANDCELPPSMELLTASRDGSYIEKEAYSCSRGTDVVFYKVVGGGHTWPGGKQFLPRQVVGNTNRSVNASELIWRFFAGHPLN
jgi:polyhydroxybutyrate depolymerase